MGPVTLTHRGETLRLVDGRNQIFAQLFDGDPATGARYLGTTGFPAKTLDEVTAHYQRMGWEPATTPNTANQKANHR